MVSVIPLGMLHSSIWDPFLGQCYKCPFNEWSRIFGLKIKATWVTKVYDRHFWLLFVCLFLCSSFCFTSDFRSWFNHLLVFFTHISFGVVVQVSTQLLQVILISSQVSWNKISRLNLYLASSTHNMISYNQRHLLTS